VLSGAAHRDLMAARSRPHPAVERRS
jgi:hypothetical protein